MAPSTRWCTSPVTRLWRLRWVGGGRRCFRGCGRTARLRPPASRNWTSDPRLSFRGFGPRWTRRSRSSCWWTWRWWWGAAIVPTSSSSMAPSSGRWAGRSALRTLLFFSSSSPISTSVAGRLLDLHGAHGYLARQVLQICLLFVKRRDSRGDLGENNLSSKCPDCPRSPVPLENLNSSRLCVSQTVKALNHLKENLKIIHRGEAPPSSSSSCRSVLLRLTLPSSPPRRHQAVQHPPGPERQHKAVRLWHQRSAGGLHRQNQRRGLPTIHGCE